MGSEKAPLKNYFHEIFLTLRKIFSPGPFPLKCKLQWQKLSQCGINLQYYVHKKMKPTHPLTQIPLSYQAVWSKVLGDNF